MIVSRTVSCRPGYVRKPNRDIQGDRKHPFFWRYSRAVREDVAMTWSNRLPGSITFLPLSNVTPCCHRHILSFLPLCFYCIILWGNTERCWRAASWHLTLKQCLSIAGAEEKKEICSRGSITQWRATIPSSCSAILFVQFCPALLLEQLALYMGTAVPTSN